MRILIDTNILLDYILERCPFVNDSSKIIKLCIEDIIDGCISAHTITNLFYILRKEMPVQERKKLLLDLCEIFIVVGIDLEKLEFCLLNDGFNDIEDCLQSECAKEFGADYIVTRNIKDFTDSAVEAIEPHEFLKRHENRR